MQLRILHPLPHLHIGGAGGLGHHVPNPSRGLGHLAQLRPAHLNINRRRQAKVQHIAHDPAGLKRELQPGELTGEPRAQPRNDRIGAQPVPPREADQEKGLMRAIDRRVEHHPAMRQADVRHELVQLHRGNLLADEGFDLAHDRLGLLHPCAFGRGHVQDKLPGIHPRKELGGQPGRQQQ